MKLIAAVDSRWGIGKNGALLASLPEDMRFFRQMTQRHVLVMGRRTLESFPGGRPLPGRLNIVVSRTEGYAPGGAVVCDSTEQLLALLSEFASGDIFVIGGGTVYRQLLPYCDTAYITKMEFDGDADAFFPELDALSPWRVTEKSETKDHNGISYAFWRYESDSALPVAFTGRSGEAARCFQMPELRWSAAETRAFLAERAASGISFEQYLTEKGYLDR